MKLKKKNRQAAAGGHRQAPVVRRREVAYQAPAESQFQAPVRRNSQVQRIPPSQMKRRIDAWSATALASPFGCEPFFSACTDQLMSLHYGGRASLLDMFGFNVTDVCLREFEFITFVRPAFSEGNPTAGYLPNPCTDPNGVEFGGASLTIEDFGRYGRKGPVRDLMQPRRYCELYPRVRYLDGQAVRDEREWDAAFVTDVLMQDIYRHLITGNAGVAGQFNGLQQWVKTGYAVNMLDSTVIDWNGQPMSGGTGITLNGGAVADNAYNLINVLLEVYRRIRTRISWAPMLAGQGQPEMILVMPTHIASCLLDYFTCWSVCDLSEDIQQQLQTYEARQFRNGLNGGRFGAGAITLDGNTIDIYPYDWETITGPSTGDIYFLTLSVGGNRFWHGEHLSAQAALDAYQGALGDSMFSMDGGRILGKIDTNNTCVQLKLWMHPRIWTNAPWAQARIMDVQCQNLLGPISPDPLATSYYPLSSFNVANFGDIGGI